MKSAFKPDEPLVRVGVVDSKNGESVSWNDVIVGRPMILDHWNFPEGSRQTVVVYSNAYSVELVVNGHSLGVKENKAERKDQHGSLLWTDVDYGHGGSVEAIARNEAGQVVARHRIETAGKAVALRMQPEDRLWHADGMDLQYVNITAVDAKGRTVPGFAEPLTVSLSDNTVARFVALDNGDHYTNDLFLNVFTKPVRSGRMQLILRSTRKAGTVKVTVKAGRLIRTLKTFTE